MGEVFLLASKSRTAPRYSIYLSISFHRWISSLSLSLLRHPRGTALSSFHRARSVQERGSYPWCSTPVRPVPSFRHTRDTSSISVPPSSRYYPYSSKRYWLYPPSTIIPNIVRETICPRLPLDEILNSIFVPLQSRISSPLNKVRNTIYSTLARLSLSPNEINYSCFSFDEIYLCLSLTLPSIAVFRVSSRN